MNRNGTILQAALLGALLAGVAAAAGGRATPFRLPLGAELFDGRAAQAFATHYEAVFPARSLGRNLWTAIGYTIFREGEPGVVIGEQDWLFTAQELGTHDGADERVARHLALILRVRDELARQGTALIVAVLPSKARIYADHLVGARPAKIHAQLYLRLQTALAAARIPSPDLDAALTLCKGQQAVFLRTDSHWTPAGARCAARALASAARRAGLQGAQVTAYRTRVGPPGAHAGDLLAFLPLAPHFAGLLPMPDTVAPEATEPVAASQPGDLFEDLPPPAVLVGTSYSAAPQWNFAGALQEALQEDVANFAGSGRGPFLPMLEYLAGASRDGAPPRLLIWEIPERSLLMPAAAGTEPAAAAQRRYEEGA